MRMERIRTGKYKVSKIVKGSGRVWILSAMLWAMFCLTACSSRETVLLEEDDLVWTEEAQDRETGGEFRLEAAPSGTAGGPGSESAGAGKTTYPKNAGLHTKTSIRSWNSRWIWSHR